MQLIHHPDLDRLYLKTLGQGSKRVAVTACDNCSGVSTLAMALAQRHLLAGHSVLYVEMNSLAPAMTALYDLPKTTTPLNTVVKNSSSQTQKDDSCDSTTHLSTSLTSPMLVTSHNSEDVVTGVLAPQEQNHILALRNPNTLNQHLERLGKNFDALVIDCAPLGAQHQGTKANQIVPADLIATAVDATILMVLAGKTKAPHLKSAMHLLAQQGIKPHAIVMNNQYNPSLGQELIRESKRIHKILPKASEWLTQKIRDSLLMIPL